MNFFILKVISSFLIAGSWIALSTLIAEKLGSKVGGLISNLPSNILVSLVFIALVNDIPYVTDAIISIPLGISICTLFLVVFIVALRFRLIIAVAISLLFWLMMAFIFSTFDLDSLLMNIFISLFIILISILFIEKVLKTPSIKNSGTQPTFQQFLLRVLFSGSIVASVVVISKYSNPYFTGIFSTFPAMLTSTMVILAINQGRSFAMATGKVLVLSLSNTVVFVIAIYLTYPVIGVLWGTIVSYSFSVIWIIFLYPLVRKLL